MKKQKTASEPQVCCFSASGCLPSIVRALTPVLVQVGRSTRSSGPPPPADAAQSLSDVDQHGTEVVHEERVKLPAYLKFALLEEAVNLYLESESYPKMLAPLTEQFAQP